DLFRGQERTAFLVVFALSLLAGLGSASLPDMALQSRRIVAVLGAGGVLVAAGAVAWTLQRRGLTAVDQATFGQIVLISLLFVLAVALLLWWPGWGQRRTLLLAGLAFANLCWANVATNLAPGGPGQATDLSPE